MTSLAALLVATLLVALPEPQVDSEKLIRTLALAVETDAAALRVPGGAVAIVRRGEPVRVLAFGAADPNDPAAFDAESCVPLGEAGETVLALLATRLAARDAIALDEPVRRLDPGFRLGDEAESARITLADLLAQRTGRRSSMRQWGAATLAADDAIAAFARSRGIVTDAAIARRQPVGLLVAGRALAEAGGAASLEAAIRSELLEPLSCVATTIGAEDATRDAAGWAWVQRDDRGVPDWLVDRAAPEGRWEPRAAIAHPAVAPVLGIRTNAGDAGRLLGAWLDAPDAAALRRQARSADGASIGFGWRLDAIGDRRAARSIGRSPGSSISLHLLPGEEIGLVVVANADAPELHRRATGHLAAMLGFAPWLDAVAASGPGIDAPDPDDAVAEIADADSVAALLHLRRGAEAWPALLTLAMEGEVRLPELGIEGRATCFLAGFDRYRERFDFGPFGAKLSICFGAEGWIADDLGPIRHCFGPRRESISMRHPAYLLAEWPTVMAGASVVGREVVPIPFDAAGATEESWIVQLRPQFLPPAEVRIGMRSGLVHEERTIDADGRRVVRTFGDWRSVDGVLLPFAIDVADPDDGRVEIRWERATPNADFVGEPFVIREPARE